MQNYLDQSLKMGEEKSEKEIKITYSENIN